MGTAVPFLARGFGKRAIQSCDCLVLTFLMPSWMTIPIRLQQQQQQHHHRPPNILQAELNFLQDPIEYF
jgi:hypothetical protein